MGPAPRPLRRARHQRGRGGTGRRGAAVRLPARLLGTGPPQQAAGRTARPGRRVGRVRRQPPRPATAPDRAAPRRPGRPRRPAPAGRRTQDRVRRTARPHLGGAAQRRTGRAVHGRLAQPDGRPPHLPARAGRGVGQAAARGPARGDGAGRGCQGGHADTADPLRAPGHLLHPRRRLRPGRPRLLRRLPRRLRAHRLPLLAAAGARGGAAARPAQPQRGRLRRLEPRRPAGGAGRGGSGGRRGPARRVPRRGSRGGRRRRGQRRIRMSTGYEMHPWADLRPAGEGPAVGRKLWHQSPGSAG